MKFIDIFLASSIDELHNERMEIGNYIRSLNDRFVEKGIYFRLHMCEYMSDEFALSRKQDEYNVVIENCDYFYFIAWRTIGKYTREEFDVALKQFKTSKQLPHISTFFKKTAEKSDETVERFIRELEETHKHYYTYFSDVDTLKYKLLLQLMQGAFGEAFLPDIKDSEILMDGKPIKNINLKKLPVYTNHQEISELQLRLKDMDIELNRARSAYESDRANKDLYEKFLDMKEQREKTAEALHDCEMQILKTSLRMTKWMSDGGTITHRMKTAMQLFDEGKLDEALAALDNEEFERELERTREKMNLLKENLTASLKEKLLKIEYLKNKARTDDVVKQIVAEYETAKNLVKEYGLDYTCILDYVWFLREQKQYTNAETVANELHIKLNGMDHVDQAFRASVCYKTGILYRDTGRMSEAEKLLKEAYDIYKILSEKDAERYEADYASACNSLGIFCRENYRIHEAERFYTIGISILRKLSEKSLLLYGGERANICHNLAYMYLYIDETEKAEKLFLEAKEVRSALDQLEPEKHFVYLGRIYNNLGEVYCKQRRYPEAEEHLLKGLEFRCKAKRQNLIYRTYEAGSKASLGVLYEKTERWAQAEMYLLEAIEVYRERTAENVGAYGSFLAENLSRLAMVYVAQQRFQTAEMLCLEALAVYRKQIGNPRADWEVLAESLPIKNLDILAKIAIAFGNIYEKIERDAEAGKIFLEAVKIYRKLESPMPNLCYAGIADVSYRIALLLQRQGKNEAKDFFASSLIYAERVADRHADSKYLAQKLSEQFLNASFSGI